MISRVQFLSKKARNRIRNGGLTRERRLFNKRKNKEKTGILQFLFPMRKIFRKARRCTAKNLWWCRSKMPEEVLPDKCRKFPASLKFLGNSEKQRQSDAFTFLSSKAWVNVVTYTEVLNQKITSVTFRKPQFCNKTLKYDTKQKWMAKRIHEYVILKILPFNDFIFV